MVVVVEALVPVVVVLQLIAFVRMLLLLALVVLLAVLASAVRSAVLSAVVGAAPPWQGLLASALIPQVSASAVLAVVEVVQLLHFLSSMVVES